MAGIQIDDSLRNCYKFFGSKMDNMIIEEIRNIQYMPRHLAHSPTKFIAQCVENVKNLEAFKKLGSPIIDDYLKGASYEKNYIQIFNAFTKNDRESLAYSLFEKSKLFNRMFEVVKFNKFEIDKTYGAIEYPQIQETKINEEKHLIQSLELMHDSFIDHLDEYEYDDDYDDDHPYRNFEYVHVYHASGELDLQLLCCKDLILKDIHVIIDERYYPDPHYSHSSNIVTQLWFSRPEAKDFSNLLDYKNIRKQVLNYLL